MLRGLGERLPLPISAKRKLGPLTNSQSSFSYQVMAGNAPWTANQIPFRIRYWWHGTNETAARVRLAVPAGWTVKPAEIASAKGEFAVTGMPDQLQNRLRLEAIAGTKQQANATSSFRLHAGDGGVCAGLLERDGLSAGQGAQRRGYGDRRRRGFCWLVAAATDPHAGWRRYFSSADYKGGANPGSVDFAAIAHGRNFEAGYGRAGFAAIATGGSSCACCPSVSGRAST